MELSVLGKVCFPSFTLLSLLQPAAALQHAAPALLHHARRWGWYGDQAPRTFQLPACVCSRLLPLKEGQEGHCHQRLPGRHLSTNHSAL